MTITRFNVPRPRRPGDLPTGYDSQSFPKKITVPPCGLEDVDRAVFEAFDSGIGFTVTHDGDEPRKPAVVFAMGEKWVLIKKRKGLRDAAGSFVLPLIAITRTSSVQDLNKDVTGRGINQQTGEIVVRRRLHKSDRGHQAMINRFFLKNQDNLATAPAQADVSQVSTLASIGDLANEPDVRDGALLVPRRDNNVHEIITIPSPQFFSATYDVVFWTQYVTHMNQMWERLVSSQLPQGNALVLTTEKGYWFLAEIDTGSYSPENNFDDHGDGRVIKHRFSLKVLGYLIAGGTPGEPTAVRRYVSCPVVSFGLAGDGASPGPEKDTVDDPYLGADDPTLPLDTGSRRLRPDARRTGMGPIESRLVAHRDDPALGALPRGVQPTKYRRVRVRDPVTGEVGTRHVRARRGSNGESVITGLPGGLVLTVEE